MMSRSVVGSTRMSGSLLNETRPTLSLDGTRLRNALIASLGRAEP